MKIAIDARELQGKPTGVGRYLSELLTAWNAMAAVSAHEFILLRPDDQHGGTGWEQLTLPGLVRNSYGAALVKEKTLNEVKARAMREFGHLDDGRCLGSVLSTGRIVMRVIEGRKPEAFYPSERPHYE